MVEIKDLSFKYPQGKENLLKNVSFHLEDGQVMAVLGENGVGKSTLIKCVDRILKPLSGTVIIDGTDTKELSGKELAKKIAYVEQSSRKTTATVFETVLLGRKPYIKWDVTKEDYEITQKAMRQLDIEELSMRLLTDLSGGELQKVMLARALAQETKVLILDEPTSNLDPKNQHEVIRLIRNIAKEKNIAVLCVLHDLNLAIRYCDAFLLLKDGQVYSIGGKEVLTEDSIRDVYSMDAHIIEHNGVPVIIPLP